MVRNEERGAGTVGRQVRLCNRTSVIRQKVPFPREICSLREICPHYQGRFVHKSWEICPETGKQCYAALTRHVARMYLGNYAPLFFIAACCIDSQIKIRAAQIFEQFQFYELYQQCKSNRLIEFMICEHGVKVQKYLYNSHHILVATEEKKNFENTRIVA